MLLETSGVILYFVTSTQPTDMSKQNPEHYRQGDIEPWDFIISQKLGFLEGNVIKYITRAGKKGKESRLDDLLKAQAYIHKLVTNEIKRDTPPASDSVQADHGSTYERLLTEYSQYPESFDY